MRLYISVLIVFLFAVAIVGCGSKCGDLPGTVATVNGKAITCSDFVNQMNMRTGREVLTGMIEQDILKQWAEEEDVAPTDEQIEKQIALQKEEGQYEEQVKVLGEAGLKRELRSVQTRMNLAKKFIKVTDEEIEQAYEGMKARFVRGPRKQVAIIVNPEKAKLEEALKAIKDGGDFDEVAQKYSDRRVTPRPPLKIWVVDGQPGMPEELAKAAKDTKLNEVSGVVTLEQGTGQTTTLILKVVASQGAIDKKLKDVKDDVADAIVMHKSQFDSDFMKKLNAKLKAAKVEVKIEQYKDLPKQFENPPEMPDMMPGQSPQ